MYKTSQIINHLKGKKTKETIDLFANIEEKLIKAGYKKPFEFKKISVNKITKKASVDPESILQNLRTFQGTEYVRNLKEYTLKKFNSFVNDVDDALLEWETKIRSNQHGRDLPINFLNKILNEIADISNQIRNSPDSVSKYIAIKNAFKFNAPMLEHYSIESNLMDFINSQKKENLYDSEEEIEKEIEEEEKGRPRNTMAYE